ncbi:MAG: hypothetical protein Q9221_002981 [Calogaya cf. arnoldii]
MSTPPAPSPPIPLIIRFALSIPDLPLTITSPTTTTPLNLLHNHIRPYLPLPYRTSPIRLIASGALLPPSNPLSTSLRLPPPSKKGKEKEEPIYIHCSINVTETLSPSTLAAEANSFIPPASESEPQHAVPNSNTEPQGFDRLLTAGLSHAEITSLRSQFLALTAHNHTPDTMPSPSQMRRLEERWLDSSSSPNPVTGAMNEDEDDDDGRGALEDMLWGTVMGFFWPVGAAMWLVREEGVWSKRRQMAAVTGALVNLAIGVMRMGSG